MNFAVSTALFYDNHNHNPFFFFLNHHYPVGDLPQATIFINIHQADDYSHHKFTLHLLLTSLSANGDDSSAHSRDCPPKDHCRVTS